MIAGLRNLGGTIMEQMRVLLPARVKQSIEEPFIPSE